VAPVRFFNSAEVKCKLRSRRYVCIAATVITITVTVPGETKLAINVVGRGNIFHALVRINRHEVTMIAAGENEDLAILSRKAKLGLVQT